MSNNTPETDAMISADQHHLEDDNFFSVSVYWRVCDLARTLERERDQTREQLNKLAEALQMITTFDYTDMQCDNGHGCRSVAIEALQSLTTKP